MFDRNLLKLEGMKGVLAALVVLALLQAATATGQAWTLASAITGLWNGGALADAAPFVVGFFACFALGRLLVYAQETMLDRFSLKEAKRLRGDLLATVFDTRSNAVDSEGSAAITTTATQGIDDVQRYLRLIPPKVIGMAAISLPILVFVFFVDWPSGIILGVAFPVIIFFMVLLGRQARERANRQYASYNRLSNHFLDTLRGIDAIVAAGAVNRTDADVFESSEKLRKATVRTLSTATLSSAVLDLCTVFGVAAIAIMLAFRLMDGSIGLQTGLVALILAPEFFSPIRSFASDYHASLDGKNALAAVLSLLKHDSSPTEEPPRKGGDSSPLSFVDVSYTYPNATVASLHGIAFSLAPCEHVALVGESGSGKSTVALLAAGLLRPSEGCVVAEGIRLIPQQPHMFSDTLENNLKLYNPSACPEDVEEVLAAVGLDALAKSLPDGLQTLIGEGNVGLSGGQAHRVALARVLLDDSARVLVFDEPTAHLDIETELDLKECILPLLEGRTVLFATHRLHWLANMDRVIALSEGEIAFSGDAQEFLTTCKPSPFDGGGDAR
ncbi:MAG: thiol reductant ABC exporter subunit CydD [Eggerthellaceae bacterium]|nr:thiol reductant ABC exporter subunit CydD [Eggerthellaceae bacterium]